MIECEGGALNSAIIIFVICIILFVIDKFKPFTVAMLGCVLLICCGVCTPEKALAGFTNDIVLIFSGRKYSVPLFMSAVSGALLPLTL